MDYVIYGMYYVKWPFTAFVVAKVSMRNVFVLRHGDSLIILIVTFNLLVHTQCGDHIRLLSYFKKGM
jgi:hypothetical protein